MSMTPAEQAAWDAFRATHDESESNKLDTFLAGMRAAEERLTPTGGPPGREMSEDLYREGDNLAMKTSLEHARFELAQRDAQIAALRDAAKAMAERITLLTECVTQLVATGRCQRDLLNRVYGTPALVPDDACAITPEQARSAGWRLRMETPELKPCPFCGTAHETDNIDTPDFVDENGGERESNDYHVRCGNCGGRSGSGIGKRDAANRWNRRTTPPDAVTISREHAERIRSALHVSIAGARMTDSEAFYLRGILDAALSGKDTPTD